MMVLVEIAIVVVLLVALVLVMGRPSRYERMTQEEFEEEAKKSSMLGAAVTGLQKVLEPSRVEHILEEKNKLRKESTDSGDHPPENSGEN